MDFFFPGEESRLTSTSFEKNDKIGLYVVECPAPLQISGNYINNAELTYSGSKWTSSERLFWPETGAVDIYAYYPKMIPTSILEQPFSVAQDQSMGTGSSDFLWAKVPSQSRQASVKVIFSHCLSKVTLKLVKGTDYVGDYPQHADVRILSTVPDGLFNLTTGTIAKNGRSSTSPIKCQQVSEDTYEAIVIPQRIDSKAPLFEMTVNGISYLMEGSFEFRAGMNHTINIVLNSSPEAINVQIGSTIQSWN